MILSKISSRKEFLLKIVKLIDSQKYGEGLTKLELVKKFNCQGALTADKWCRESPEIRARVLYVKCNNGRNMQAVFVNKSHKKKLIESGIASEKY